MTNDEKLNLLQRWRGSMQESDDLIDPVIEALELAPTSPICEAVWRLQDALTESVAREIGGDADHWLKWYAQDNDFGKKAMKAGRDACNKQPICTLEDLLWVMDGAQ